MSKSIMSNERKCYVCGYTKDLHRHHIFFGRKDHKHSEKYGCWCYLCGVHHNLSNVGVHFDKELDDKLKAECQQKWEEIYGTRQEFMRIFFKNYL